LGRVPDFYHSFSYLDCSTPAAEVSRSWLYRQPEIRALITGLRTSPGPPTSTPASHRATTESLHALLDASRHEVTRLRAENATLRNETARRLGQNRADPPNNIHPTTSTHSLHADQPARTQTLTSATCLLRRSDPPPGRLQNHLQITVVRSRSLFSRSRCSVLEFGARASPTESVTSQALLLAVSTGTWRNRKRGRRLTSTSRLTPMWPHPCSVSSNVTSHVSVRAIGRL
jgi:hypothetical protein